MTRGRSKEGDSCEGLSVATAESPVGRRRRPGGGRRRDPLIDQRIIDAARDVYTREGWAGFTLDAVSKGAGVSRDAIGRRHPDLRHLLHAVLMDGEPPRLNPAAGGSVHEILEDHAMSLYDYFTVGDGPILFRVHLEARAFPEVYLAYRNQIVDPSTKLMNAAVRELFVGAGIDVDAFDIPVFVESVNGAVLLHALVNQATEGDYERSVSARASIKGQVAQALSAIGSLRTVRFSDR